MFVCSFIFDQTEYQEVPNKGKTSAENLKVK